MLVLHTDGSSVGGDVDNIGEGSSTLLNGLRNTRIRNVNGGIIAKREAECIAAVDVLKRKEKSVGRVMTDVKTYRDGGLGNVAIVKDDANRAW